MAPRRTLGALASQTAAIGRTLDATPAALADVRGTLGRAERTLGLAQSVTQRLAPGVREVRRIAAPLNRTLATLQRVGPDARATLATTRRAAPDISALLGKVTGDAPRLRSIGEQAQTALRCIRPYTPEIIAFVTNWAGFQANDDGRDHYLRAQVQQFLPTLVNAMPTTSAEAKKLFPGLDYGFPRPPGTGADQPWYQPDCRATEQSFDPNFDPEARPYDQKPAKQRGGR